MENIRTIKEKVKLLAKEHFVHSVYVRENPPILINDKMFYGVCIKLKKTISEKFIIPKINLVFLFEATNKGLVFSKTKAYMNNRYSYEHPYILRTANDVCFGDGRTIYESLRKNNDMRGILYLFRNMITEPHSTYNFRLYERRRPIRKIIYYILKVIYRRKNILFTDNNYN